MTFIRTCDIIPMYQIIYVLMYGTIICYVWRLCSQYNPLFFPIKTYTVNQEKCQNHVKVITVPFIFFFSLVIAEKIETDAGYSIDSNISVFFQFMAFNVSSEKWELLENRELGIRGL